MPRFVLLRHECPPEFGKPSHWDLLLEDGGTLLAWRLTVLPKIGGSSIDAERLANHRLEYLDYEGPVGGDRGDVRRVDASEFEWLQRQPGCWRVEVHGRALRGTLEIESPNGDECQMTLADSLA